ncbi:MAG: 4-hydroxythreonine-4-phosphate dehydrogenase PdxA [Dehalococcoidales bacterium]|nr:MAG: 4-hydroxythreonine-4-phosphate dehydrogenase PdxA [Dehalococcoidales bacterium]
MSKKIIAVTMGDAAGIGPEIIVKALGDPMIYDICSPLLIGDSGVINKTIKSLESTLSLHPVRSVADVEGRYGSIDMLDLQNLPDEIILGKVSADCGRAAMEYISKAAEMTGGGEAAAMATAPINKESVVKAGYPDTGHMKYLARITGTTEYAAMLMTGALRVVHLSDHYSLKEACDLVKRDLILAKLILINDSFLKWNVDKPRIGVAALNPHGSDGGLFGNQEENEITPAVNDAKKQGINASGPFPADSIFYRAISGEFDVILAMYHDQGHIAVKVHGFENSVAVTLGLPFVRTSVDHGTAFDIAGQGIADHQSMIEAITTAVELS